LVKLRGCPASRPPTSAITSEGLVRPSGRAENDYRFFTDADLHRLRFIRMCRALDMSLDEVRTCWRWT
jgi:DNA-binding transcriptional MerR regulator